METIETIIKLAKELSATELHALENAINSRRWKLLREENKKFAKLDEI